MRPPQAHSAGQVQPLLERLLHDRPALVRRQAEADRLIASSSAAHLVHELARRAKNRPWRLDPVPYVLPSDAFDELAAAVTERLQGMEELLADLYGRRRVVREGLVPAEALSSSRRYRLSAVGAPSPPRWLTTFAVDVVAVAGGRWRVVQDLADTPTGVGYALLDRSVMARLAFEVLGPGGAGDLASISGFAAEIRHALAGAANVPSPRIVLFSGGVDEAAYVEHSSLARLLGFNLVQGPDLVVRSGRLWLRTLGGLDPIDVVYRRVGDAWVDPIEVSATSGSGVPGLLFAAAEGGVVLANGHGAGVLEDAALAGYWAGAIDALVGSAPRLELLRPDDELVTVPALRQGVVGEASVVVRLHAVAGVDGVTVMAGGNGRVLAPGDDARQPTAHVAKDVWVLGAGRAAPVIVAPPLPQVDLTTSVPTRAADSLFWVGRSAERAEAIARTVRVVAARRQQDPSLVSSDGGRWARRMARVLRVVREEQLDVEPIDGRPITALDDELRQATVAVGEQLDSLVAEMATVGEYLSGTTNRILGNLAALRKTFDDGRAPIDALDDALAELAALAGLWAESTVRGPAWRFGDLGRRLERALVVLGLVDACLGHPDAVAPGPANVNDAPAHGARGPFDDVAVDMVARSALDVVLAANESLVAYRRHHRSDVELDAAVDLLLDDVDNPRSFAASVARIADHVAAIDWDEGEAAARHLLDVVERDRPLTSIGAAHEAVLELARLIVTTWFATPVNPVVVRAAVKS